MRFLIYIILISVAFSCTPGKSTDILSFKTGSFKTYLGARKDSSFFYRTADLQIETYRSKVDTFKIKWKSNFEYELLKVHPKGKLDSIPFVVKITGFKKNYYKFKGAYQGSNFIQSGTTYIINP